MSSAVAQPLALDIDEHAPFTAAQLDAALRARDLTGSSVRVVATETGVEITVRGRTRDLTLGTRTGDDAARLVALAAADLLQPDLAPPPVEHLDDPEGDRPATRMAPRGWSIGLVGTSAIWTGVIAGGSAELVGPAAGHLLAVELGGGSLVGGDLHATTAVVRAGLAKRIGVLELRAGMTLTPILVTDGATDMTVLVGGSASAHLRLPIATGVHAVISAGTDAYATRTEYLRAGMAPATTPFVAPFFGAGIELSP